MSCCDYIPEKVIDQGKHVTLMLRLRDHDGDLHTAESISSITYVVTDTSNESVVTNGSLSVMAVMSDALSTEDWEEDVYGWNFRHVMPPSWFPDSDTLYAVVLTITPDEGYAETQRVHVRTRDQDE